MRTTLSLIVMVLGLVLSGAPAKAAGMVQVPGDVQQGQLVIGWAPGNTVIQLGDEVLPLTEDGQFVFGFGRDQGPTAELTVRYHLPLSGSGTYPSGSRPWPDDCREPEGYVPEPDSGR